MLKRGLALTPVKFGISFNLVHLNQAGALVHVYGDGSVLVNHGGTEMGQGLNTKVAQVVAHELGVDFGAVRVTATDTQKVANTSATAASTGSDLNGKAAQDAAQRIKARLVAFAAGRHGVDASDIRFAGGNVVLGAKKTIAFRELVVEAYMARVQLWSDGFYATPGLSWDRETMQGRPFYYFAYGAAVSEVVVDTLTGEWKLLAAHVLHDAGKSLNPAIDIGQVEGGFIQGMGWLTMEELVWHPNDGSPRAGLLLTHAPSTYKIPTANDCPPVFDVRLWKDGVGDDNVAETIHRSKATGEPPLLLPFSVFFAIRDAVSAAGGHRVDPPLSAPATSEAILRAITAVQAAATTMSELRLRDRAAAWLAEARPAVVVEVTAVRGSVPRGVGTRMLVGVDESLGTIGGGHLELKAITAARAAARERRRRTAQRAVVRARPVARPVLRRRGDARVRAARRGGVGALAGERASVPSAAARRRPRRPRRRHAAGDARRRRRLVRRARRRLSRCDDARLAVAASHPPHLESTPSSARSPTRRPARAISSSPTSMRSTCASPRRSCAAATSRSAA